jgi:hypothetical protein
MALKIMFDTQPLPPAPLVDQTGAPRFYMAQEICAMFQVPCYLVIGPTPRNWGNPEAFHMENN